jgi:hypothetical protein
MYATGTQYLQENIRAGNTVCLNISPLRKSGESLIRTGVFREKKSGNLQRVIKDINKISEGQI